MGDYIDNVDHDAETMGDLYESAGYTLTSLLDPRNVDASDVTDSTAIVAYTATRDGYQLVEWDATLLPHDADVFQEYRIKWSAEEITHVLKWAQRRGGAPKAEAIGYGDAFMDFYERNDRTPPNSFDRKVSRVRGISDDFIRVKL